MKYEIILSIANCSHQMLDNVYFLITVYFTELFMLQVDSFN